MEIPDLVHEALGGEEIRSGVAIGDEEVVCATASRTLIYRPEGILSDERIEEYSHDVDRLVLSEGRRKTTFKLTYVDGTRSFSVPASHGRDVLTLLLEGILGVDGVLEEDESVVGAFRFSELTLVIAENRLVRHIGETVWDEDFTQYEYGDLTGLDFQEGSVATEIVISIDGRPQRIKTPRQDARLVEETLKKAVFEFYDVATMAELRQVVEPTEEDAPSDDEVDDLTLGSNIDPLVSGTESDPPHDAEMDPTGEVDASEFASDQSTDGSPVQRDAAHSAGQSGTNDSEQPVSAARDSGGKDAGGTADGAEDPARDRAPADSDPASRSAPEPDADVATANDVEALREQVATLSSAVERQNDLLKKQHGAIKRLLDTLEER